MPKRKSLKIPGGIGGITGVVASFVVGSLVVAGFEVEKNAAKIQIVSFRWLKFSDRSN